MNRLLNVTLVLSLIANVILALTGSPAKATQPGTQPVRVHEKSIIPQARVLSKTNDRSDEDVRQQPAVVIPWVLAKEGGLRHHGYDFGIPDALIRGLELGPAEHRAVLKMNQVLREIEERGIQPSEDSMVIVEINEKQQQAALENFVAEIEQALPEAKAAMLSENAVACNYLRWASLQLKVIETKGQLTFKVAHLNRPDKEGVRGGGGSTTRTLKHYPMEQLRKRWGHSIDFTPLEETLKAREEGMPQL
ncbi:MAG: hypothetical protein P1U82_01960 [Verrucomicrobiales bacterium]|jgi:hypothetical protein|nr:hypothetical protein [Verrucomicrobiales bacterium]